MATIEQSGSWAAASRPPGRRWTPAGLAASAPSPIPARRHQCCSAAEGPNGLRLAVLLRRVAHAALAWWRSATMEDHAVARERERGLRCMAAVGHDGGPCGSPGTGERRCMAAIGHDGGPRGSPGTGERLTMHGGGRPRWRTMRYYAVEAREREREGHTAWLRSATMEDHALAWQRERGSCCMAAVGHDGGPRGSQGTGKILMLHSGDRPRYRTTQYPGKGRDAHAAWRLSATMEVHAVARQRERGSRCIARVGHDGGPRGCPRTGERLTLHGGGRPRWRTMRYGSPRSGERLTLHGGGRPRRMSPGTSELPR